MDAKPAIEAKPSIPTQSINVEAKAKTIKPTKAKTVKPKIVQSKLVEGKTVEAKTIKSKPMESKPMEPKTIEVRSTKPTNSRYEGSAVQKWDAALFAGGTWPEMSQRAGITPGKLRAHAKYRTDVQKKYRLEENGDLIRLVVAVD